MKKIPNLCFALPFLFALLSAFNLAADHGKVKETKERLLSHNSFAAIKKRGVLRVAMNAIDRPPFFMVDEEGELIGVDVEMAKKIAKELNLRLDINRDSQTFDAVVQRVADGLSDIAISKLSLTLKRAQIVRYTEPYFILHKSVLINRVKLLQAGLGISIEEVLKKKGATIAAPSQNSYEEFSKRLFPEAELYASSGWFQDIVPKVISGELWAAFRDELETRRVIFMFKDSSFHLLAINLKDELDPIMMVVDKEAPLFQDWLNLYLKYIYKKEGITKAVERFKEYVYKDRRVEQ